MKTISITEAKATFTELIEEVEQGSSVLITRRGKPVAAIVGISALEEVERAGLPRSAEGLASLAGGWEGSDELVRALGSSPRR